MTETIQPTDIPTPDEVRDWTKEAEAYKYRPPIETARPNSPERKGWGIPPDRAAPEDCIDYVIAKFRQDEADLHWHDAKDPHRFTPIHPKYSWALGAAVMAHFAWFKSYPGAQWINRFFGIQEIEPFWTAYAYYWINPRYPDSPVELDPQLGELRIFRPWDRNDEPPIDAPKYKGMTPFDQMVYLMNAYRNPYAGEMPTQSEEVYRWVSEHIANWFKQASPNTGWPFYKEGRVTGIQWVRDQKRPDGNPLYEGLARVGEFNQKAPSRGGDSPVRAYRWTAGNGRVYWFGRDEMRIDPRTDQHRKSRKDMTEPQIREKFLCRSCRQVRTCTPQTAHEHMCCHCYAIQVERGSDMPTLNFCTMASECKACPERIGSKAGLIRLKNRINQGGGVRGPIPRPR